MACSSTIPSASSPGHDRPRMEHTPKGACDRGVCSVCRSAWLGRRRRRRTASAKRRPGFGASLPGGATRWHRWTTSVFLTIPIAYTHDLKNPESNKITGKKAMGQAGLRHLCADIVNRTDGAFGCALVDLETGLPLASDVKPSAPLGPTSMELLSAIGVSYFDRPQGAHFDDDSTEADDLIQEIQTTTDDAYYFMARVPDAPQEILILVMDPQATNLGLGWMSMRTALAQIRAINAEDGFGNGSPPDARPVPHQPPQAGPDRVFERRTGNRRSIWD